MSENKDLAKEQSFKGTCEFEENLSAKDVISRHTRNQNRVCYQPTCQKPKQGLLSADIPETKQGYLFENPPINFQIAR